MSSNDDVLLCEKCGSPVDHCKCVCPYCGESTDCKCCVGDAVTGG